MAEEITAGGIAVPLTHPDKVLFPEWQNPWAGFAGAARGLAPRASDWPGWNASARPASQVHGAARAGLAGLPSLVRGYFLLDRGWLTAALGNRGVPGRRDTAAAAYVLAALDESAHLAALRGRVMRTPAREPDYDDRGYQPDHPDHADGPDTGRGR